MLNNALSENTNDGLNENMSGDEIFQRILRFQKQVFGAAFPRNKDELTEKYSMLIAMECFELLQNTSFKPHKPARETLDAESIRYELVDIYIYTIACASMWFIDHAEMMHYVKRKIDVNQTNLDRVIGEK